MPSNLIRFWHLVMVPIVGEHSDPAGEVSDVYKSKLLSLDIVMTIVKDFLLLCIFIVRHVEARTQY